MDRYMREIVKVEGIDLIEKLYTEKRYNAMTGK